MKSALITGADGFLGKNLVSGLLRDGVEVYAVVYPGNNIYEKYNDKGLHVISADLTKATLYVNEFPKEIDVMYHFAWIGVKPELRNDFDVQLQNLSMSMECMKLANELGVKKIICPGSTNEYLYYGKPINKQAVPSPNNAYGAVKVSLRYLCGEYARNKKIDFVYTVIAGIYAPDRRDNNVIFYTIDKLLKKEQPELTKLEQLWDYVYIDDVVDALVAIGQKGKNGAFYAIGHGDNWSLINYINIIHEKIDDTIPLGIGLISYDRDVLPSSCVDLTDLKNDTGYEPKVDFEEGISYVIEKIREEMEN